MTLPDGITLHVGDCLDVLRTLPDASVNCCVTSPPYWGLRDYGTAEWEGGDSSCDHMESREFVNPKNTLGPNGHLPETNAANRMHQRQYRYACGKCGARRVDRQIGLEETPDAYVAKMVAVFREVRRVLRDDGTCWINLGSSYASGGSDPIQSLSPERVPACGTCGRELQGSLCVDPACPDCGDERRDATSIHRVRNARNDQCDERTEPLPLQTDRDSESSDCASASPSVSPRGARRSSTRASFRRDRAACVPAATASAFLEAPRSSSCDVPSSVGSCSWSNHTMFSQLSFKPKNLVPIPWMVAMALQADGWWLRQDIIWHKPNPMPESVTDRCTKAHEYVFLLSKRERYWYDADAIAEQANTAGDVGGFTGYQAIAMNVRPSGNQIPDNGRSYIRPETRNKRSVWTITTKPYAEAHFATFPEELPRTCILAGCPVGGTVLDPFAGSGTTLSVAHRLGRKAVGIELNPEYAKLIDDRVNETHEEHVAVPLFEQPELFA